MGDLEMFGLDDDDDDDVIEVEVGGGKGLGIALGVLLTIGALGGLGYGFWRWGSAIKF